jgi:hypothetical protein
MGRKVRTLTPSQFLCLLAIIKATAPSHETTEWADVDSDVNFRKVRRGKPAEEIPSKLAVEIALKLKPE